MEDHIAEGKKNEETLSIMTWKDLKTHYKVKKVQNYTYATIPFIGGETGQEYIFGVPCTCIKIHLEGYTKN